MTLDEKRDEFERFHSDDSCEILKEVTRMRDLAPSLSDSELCEAADALSSLFYIDSYERPDLQGVVDAALEVIGGFGQRIIPYLLSEMRDSDLKAALYYARALGMIGPPAIDPIVDACRSADDPVMRSFFLYALGKIRDPRLSVFIPMIVSELFSVHREVRDTAARTLGKIAEVADPAEVPSGTRDEMAYRLMDLLADENAGVRSKAVRTLGKLGRCGFLSEPQGVKAASIIRDLLGVEGRTDPDRAFIVRKEAEEALLFLPLLEAAHV